jgi:hypothetical protein
MNRAIGLFLSRISHRTGISLLLLASGCGYAEYESRLAESRKYYAHLDKIEQSLAPKWSVAGGVMDLRVPQQFVPIPPAPLIQKEDGTFEQPESDPRQPDYLNLTFPDLFGAWESVFKVAKGGGATEDHKGYIYVVSNYWELAGEHATDAGEFTNKLKTYLTDTLQVAATDETVQMHPKVVPAYQSQKSYDTCSFKGKNINGTNYTFELFSHKSGSIIGVIIVAMPEGIEMPQKINERIPMMLESFNLTSTPPKVGSDKAAPAAGNQPAGPAGF